MNKGVGGLKMMFPDEKISGLQFKLVDLFAKRKIDTNAYDTVWSVANARPGSVFHIKREQFEEFYNKIRNDPHIDARLGGYIKAMVEDINGRSVSQASIQDRKRGQPASDPPSPPVSDPPSPSVSVSDASSPRSDTPPPYGSPPAYSSKPGTPLQPATEPGVTVTEILHPQVVSGSSPPPPYASDTAVSGLPPPYTSATASPPAKPPKKKSTGCFGSCLSGKMSGGGSIIKKNKTKRRKKPTKRRKKPTKRIKKRTIRGHQRRTYKQSGGMNIPSERDLQRELQERDYIQLRSILSNDREFGPSFRGPGNILTLDQYKMLASDEYAGRFVGSGYDPRRPELDPFQSTEREQIRSFLKNGRTHRGPGAVAQARIGGQEDLLVSPTGDTTVASSLGFRRGDQDPGRDRSSDRSGRRRSGRSGRSRGSDSRSRRSGRSSGQSKFLVPPTGDTTVSQFMSRQFMTPPSSGNTTVMFDANKERRKIIERLTENGTWVFPTGSNSPLLVYREKSSDGTFDMSDVYEQAANAEMGGDRKYRGKGGAEQFLIDKGVHFIHGGPQVSEPEPGQARTPDLILETKLDQQNRATEMILNRLKDQGAWKKTNGEECDDDCLQAAASKEQSNSLGGYQNAGEYLNALGYSAEPVLVMAKAVEPVVIKAEQIDENSPNPVTPVSDPDIPDEGIPVSGPLVPERGAAATVPAGGSRPVPPYRGPQTERAPTKRSRGCFGFRCVSKSQDVSGGGFIINKNKMKRHKKPTKRHKKQTRRYKRLR